MTAAPDPLADLIGRSLRIAVSDVRSEVVRRDTGVELERVRFRADGAERSLVLKRVPSGRDLEVQLLPFLGRKSANVPRVHSRGIPPPAVPAKRWLLIDDTLDAPSACDVDPRAIVAAKVAIEQAVAGDGPALRALGVPVLPPAAIADLAPPEQAQDAAEAARRLADWPMALVHGDLSCTNAVLGDGPLLIVEWRWAHLGCPLLDIARLTGDLVERGEAVLGIALSRVYGALIDRQIGTDELRAAELLERLVARHRRD